VSNHSPIPSPPPELLDQWCITGKSGNLHNALTLAYRAGADQELEACCEWLERWKVSLWYNDDHTAACQLRAARRPKPPSLKEQARQIIDCLIEGDCLNDDDAVTLRRVLEALDD
jgi:hypothetical protein